MAKRSDRKVADDDRKEKDENDVSQLRVNCATGIGRWLMMRLRRHGMEWRPPHLPPSRCVGDA